VDIGWPITVAVGGVEVEARRAGASHAAGGAGTLDKVLTVALDGHHLPGGCAFTGLARGGTDGWRSGFDGSLGGDDDITGGVGSWGFDGDFAVEENIDDGGEKRIFALPAERALEVVQIQSPDHTAGESLILDVLGLDANSFGVVVGDPLISTIGVHHFVLGMILGGPALFDVLADFVVRDESLFASVSSSGTRTFSRGSHASL